MSSIRFPSSSRYRDSQAFLDAVYRWMCRLTATHLYRDYHKAGFPLPSLDELAVWLDDAAWPKVRRLVVDYADTSNKHSWSGEQYQRQLVNACAFCLDTHDGVKVESRARHGGLNSRRGSTFTVEMLLQHDGLSIAQQAKAMGCSRRTVSSLRALVESYDPVLAGVFDQPANRERVHA